MSIPINNVSPRIQYLASNGQTVFTVPFPFFEDTDLSVYLTPNGNVESDAEDILVLATDYTVTGAGDASGGTITLVVAAALDDLITIVRTMPEERLSLYLQGGQFTAEQVNNDFSMDVMMNQQNQMRVETLTPHYQNTSPVDTQDLILPRLLANQIWMMNSAQTAIEATDFAGPVSVVSTAGTLSFSVTQVAHGFSVGDLVRCTAANTYATAIATSAANAEVCGIVTAVASADVFTLTIGGLITGLSLLTPGTAYYLSPSVAGAFTAIRPTASGQVVKPVFIAIGAGSAIWTNMLGIVL